jgi:hypothetical protein
MSDRLSVPYSASMTAMMKVVAIARACPSNAPQSKSRQSYQVFFLAVRILSFTPMTMAASQQPDGLSGEAAAGVHR